MAAKRVAVGCILYIAIDLSNIARDRLTRRTAFRR